MDFLIPNIHNNKLAAWPRECIFLRHESEMIGLFMCPHTKDLMRSKDYRPHGGLPGGDVFTKLHDPSLSRHLIKPLSLPAEDTANLCQTLIVTTTTAPMPPPTTSLFTTTTKTQLITQSIKGSRLLENGLPSFGYRLAEPTAIWLEFFVQAGP